MLQRTLNIFMKDLGGGASSIQTGARHHRNQALAPHAADASLCFITQDALLVEDDPAACGVIPPHAHAPNRIDEMPADGAAGVIPITASSTSAHNILEHARQEVTNTIREEAGQAKEAASQKVNSAAAWLLIVDSAFSTASLLTDTLGSF